MTGKRAIIHIGLPKTGTTSIQYFLAHNSSRMAEMGIHYQKPDAYGHWARNAHAGPAIAALTRAGENVQSLHLRRVLGIATMADQAAYATEFEQKFGQFVESRGGGLFVMSGEPMGSWLRHPELIQALDVLLAGWFEDRTYLVYFRDPLGWLPSLYSQYVKGGGQKPWKEMLQTFTQEDYYTMLNRWKKSAPDARIMPRLMDRSYLKDGDLITDLCHVLGVSPDDHVRTPERNISLSAQEIFAIQKANRIFGYKVGKSPKFRRLLRRVFAGRSKYRMSAAEQREVMEMTWEAHEKLRREWFPDRDHLFPSYAAFIDARIGRDDPDSREPALPSSGRGIACETPQGAR